ncbi:Uma2 family endonuclease [Acidicapsa ligni]|uniref:Uma2 family endonuclease n=1 Tax=Acidicapsa ligni TaxID=542300 RepID=UPI0021E0C4A3|nr:Uma2 family endonuclease [Acidicapsa ligni]
MSTGTQATGTQIPIEVYLRSSEYDPDAEYVDGEIEERPAGEFGHADWQAAISAWFLSHAKEWNIRVLAELRVQVSPTRFRVPDVTVLDRALPVEQVITRPPLAVFEVLSPQDNVHRLKHKLADYAQMGIPEIWVVDPDAVPGTEKFERYENGHLVPATRFAHHAIQFELSQIASLLQG